MEKEFIAYEQALALKELGFDEPCNTCYDKLEMVASYGASVFDYKNYNTTGYMVSRPTFSQAFRWFREKHKLGAIVSQFGWGIENEFGQIIHNISDAENPLCYEEAELECLKRLIEIANEK